MKTPPRHLLQACAVAAAFAGIDRCGNSFLAAQADDVIQEIVAAQVRKQGYSCKRTVSATRDSRHPQEKGGWILVCSDGTYDIHLAPRRPAVVEVVK